MNLTQLLRLVAATLVTTVAACATGSFAAEAPAPPTPQTAQRGVMEGRLQDTRNGGEGIDLQLRRIIEPATETTPLDSGRPAPDNRRP